MPQEKRRYERFDNGFVAISIARAGLRGIFGKKPATECTNFSRTGLQLDCTGDLEPGEKLLVDVELDDISLRELKAEVVTKQPTKRGWCYGIRFCLEESRKVDVFHSLLVIEGRLRTALKGEAGSQTAV